MMGLWMARSAFTGGLLTTLGPVKPRRSTTGSMGPLMGTDRAAWGIKLLLMTVSAYQVAVCLLVDGIARLRLPNHPL